VGVAQAVGVNALVDPRPARQAREEPADVGGVQRAAGGAPGLSDVARLLPRLAAKAGVEKRVHAHGLRHAHAAELAAEGLPVNVVQQQLGHGSLATTDRYLRHIAPRERVEAMRAREWAV